MRRPRPGRLTVLGTVQAIKGQDQKTGRAMEQRATDGTSSGQRQGDHRSAVFLISYLCSFSPVFNLFAEEIEAQRTGRLIAVDILAIELIALHKQLVF